MHGTTTWLLVDKDASEIAKGGQVACTPAPSNVAQQLWPRPATSRGKGCERFCSAAGPQLAMDSVTAASIKQVSRFGATTQ